MKNIKSRIIFILKKIAQAIGTPYRMEQQWYTMVASSIPRKLVLIR